MSLFITFVIFNILNVIIQTIKSIATVKCGKTVAAIVNAVAYGLYTYIIILTACELPIWVKALTVGLCNLVGVWVVKYFEEKARKDALWKIEATILSMHTNAMCNELKNADLTYSYIDITKYKIFNVYCETQEESKKAKEILAKYNAKYFVTESKIL